MAILESTKSKALREARGLLQEFGFNGFSFQHIADLLGIKKPSLYDHFASKEVLGQALVKDYAASFLTWTTKIQDQSPKEQVRALFEIFYKFAQDERKLCPLSALLADVNSLPKSIRKNLMKTCAMQRKWLAEVIDDGQRRKVFRRDISSEVLAESVMAMALGSQLMARGGDSPGIIHRVAKNALELLIVSG